MNRRLEAPEAFWAELRALHATPPRHYHTLDHVEEVLGHYDQVAASAGWHRPREVLLAVLFHDAVYVCGAADNEARSARAAEDAIARHLTGVDAARVAELILLTARHGSIGEVDRDAALFLDCDMAILGAEPDDYRRYAAQIAAEWAPVLPADRFRAGRRAFLERLLARDAIFLSDHFRARLEERARSNIAAEVAVL
jgi:predicted metal-dependent HD superfamily phosphohydrolase